MSQLKSKIFFGGLDELRAFAALAVVLHHIELYKNRLGLSSLFDVDILKYFIGNLGKNGVYLFFVLSGFLITYLLLEEKSSTGGISVAKFYSRRILRIWPLYFIILLVGFLFLPLIYKAMPYFFEGQTFYNQRIENLVYGKNVVLFLFFFSNVALQIYGPVAGAAQSWSVSVEEQFYFIWPWIVKICADFLWIVLLLIVILINLVNFKIAWFNDFPFVKAFLSSFAIDFMAIGGLTAMIYRKHGNIIQVIITKKVVVLLILFLVIGHLFYEISHSSLALSFGLLIVMVVESNLKVKLLSRLGKWSYGIYMYHPVVMYFSFSLVNKLHINSIIGANLAYYCLILGLTILVSYFSYRYIELVFLKLKHKFSPVISGNL